MEPVSVSVLDHGRVALLDVFGNDQRIVEAARVSYGQGTTQRRSDEGLIRYLMRHRHTSPFEMCETLFYLKVPITVARQLVRHRTASLNEVSGRYSELPEEIYVPAVDQCGPQSATNNQGRVPVTNPIVAQKAQHTLRDATHAAYETYDSLLHVSGVSRELSRGVLPLHTYTALYWKCDLHNLLHFLKLRMDHHAQYEIRVVATAMYDLVRPHFPLACTAWEDYILHGTLVSRMEQELLGRMVSGAPIPSKDVAAACGMSTREYNDFQAWISQISAQKTGE